MRYWKFGLFQSQHDVITFADIGFGRSIITEGSATNQDQGAADYNQDTHQWNVTVSADTSFAHGAIEIEKELLKSKLGQIPILVRVAFRPYIKSDRTSGIQIWRFINQPDIKDCGNRYRDLSALITWYEDVYAPMPGQDIEDPPAYSYASQAFTQGDYADFEITSIVERALRDNINVSFMLRGSAGDREFVTTYSDVGVWPYFEFYFFYPVEFYQADSGGDIDLTRIIDDDPGNEYYLGAVERGQTGSPVKGFFRNYTEATQQIEIFDDHPESEAPVQRVGTGTGELDYVALDDNAVSQLYEAVFYSATQYEIRATAYRDNAISLHPTINADASWRGTVGSDFAAPTGGLRIPAAAWQSAGIALDDEFEIGVRGNTTDTSWPADSNDQVEITFDDSGNPDNGEWRPVTGHRIQTSAAVTIDATTKLIPTRFIDPTHWPIGNKAFIHNLADYDAGSIKSVQEADIGTPVFSGSGTDDLSVSGNYNGTITDDYVVEIDAGGTPGTYKWSNDGGGTWEATGIVPTGSPQLLENGIYVTIPSGTAHTLADTWTMDVKAFAIELEGLTSGSTVYGTGSIVATTLPFRDVPAAVYDQVNQASGASSTPASRVYLESTAGFTQGDDILLVQASGDQLSEAATIAAGGVQPTYLDLTAVLENDYAIGDFVTKSTTGQTPFWLRAVATLTTVEQLKSLRLNARML
jgi:hypothetical protein